MFYFLFRKFNQNKKSSKRKSKRLDNSLNSFTKKYDFTGFFFFFKFNSLRQEYKKTNVLITAKKQEIQLTLFCISFFDHRQFVRFQVSFSAYFLFHTILVCAWLFLPLVYE